MKIFQCFKPTNSQHTLNFHPLKTQYFPILTREIQAQEMYVALLGGRLQFGRHQEGTAPSRGLALGHLEHWLRLTRQQKRSAFKHLRDWPRHWQHHIRRDRQDLRGTVETQLRAPWIHSQIRSPCPKLTLKGCGLKRSQIQCAPELQLNCMCLLGPRGLPKASTLA